MKRKLADGRLASRLRSTAKHPNRVAGENTSSLTPNSSGVNRMRKVTQRTRQRLKHFCRKTSKTLRRKDGRNTQTTICHDLSVDISALDSFIQSLCQLHEHSGASGANGRGYPLNVLILRFLASQAIAACCRATRRWANLEDGKRYCRCVDDTRGPPHVPLDRVAAMLVETLKLGQDGRDTPEERCRLVVSCRKAELLTSLYGNLSGLSRELNWSSEVPNGFRAQGLHNLLGGISNSLALTPCLALRKLRLRQCSLHPKDVAYLLHCTPQLQEAVFLNEQLVGLADALDEVQPCCTALWRLELQDCSLRAVDADALLLKGSLPGLRSVHFQAMDLQGLALENDDHHNRCYQKPLASIRELSLLDCNLGIDEIMKLLPCFPLLEELALCGNPLGSKSMDTSEFNPERTRRRWPRLSSLRRADLRHCELGSDDEEDLRQCLPPEVEIVFVNSVPAEDAGGSSNRHVFFESSSDESV